MERLTIRTETGYSLPPARLEAAAARLGALETLYEELSARHSAASGELEELRAAGRGKSVRFRERLAQKLTDAAILDALSGPMAAGEG